MKKTPFPSRSSKAAPHLRDLPKPEAFAHEDTWEAVKEYLLHLGFTKESQLASPWEEWGWLNRLSFQELQGWGASKRDIDHEDPGLVRLETQFSFGSKDQSATGASPEKEGLAPVYYEFLSAHNLTHNPQHRPRVPSLFESLESLSEDVHVEKSWRVNLFGEERIKGAELDRQRQLKTKIQDQRHAMDVTIETTVRHSYLWTPPAWFEDPRGAEAWWEKVVYWSALLPPVESDGENRSEKNNLQDRWRFALPSAETIQELEALDPDHRLDHPGKHQDKKALMDWFRAGAYGNDHNTKSLDWQMEVARGPYFNRGSGNARNQWLVHERFYVKSERVHSNNPYDFLSEWVENFAVGRWVARENKRLEAFDLDEGKNRLRHKRTIDLREKDVNTSIDDWQKQHDEVKQTWLAPFKFDHRKKESTEEQEKSHVSTKGRLFGDWMDDTAWALPFMPSHEVTRLLKGLPVVQKVNPYHTEFFPEHEMLVTATRELAQRLPQEVLAQDKRLRDPDLSPEAILNIKQAQSVNRVMISWMDQHEWLNWDVPQKGGLSKRLFNSSEKDVLEPLFKWMIVESERWQEERREIFISNTPKANLPAPGPPNTKEKVVLDAPTPSLEVLCTSLNPQWPVWPYLLTTIHVPKVHNMLMALVECQPAEWWKKELSRILPDGRGLGPLLIQRALFLDEYMDQDPVDQSYPAWKHIQQWEQALAKKGIDLWNTVEWKGQADFWGGLLGRCQEWQFKEAPPEMTAIAAWLFQRQVDLGSAPALRPQDKDFLAWLQIKDKIQCAFHQTKERSCSGGYEKLAKEATVHQAHTRSWDKISQESGVSLTNRGVGYMLWMRDRFESAQRAVALEQSWSKSVSEEHSENAPAPTRKHRF